MKKEPSKEVEKEKKPVPPKKLHGKRLVRSIVYLAIATLIVLGSWLLDLYLYQPSAFDATGAAGVYSKVTIEAISRIPQEFNGNCYVVYVNQSNDTKGLLKVSDADYENLARNVEEYGSATTTYSTSVTVKGLSMALDDDFIQYCISTGIADSENSADFLRQYGKVCLNMNTRYLTVPYLINRVALYLLLPLCFLLFLIRLIRRLYCKTPSQVVPLPTAANRSLSEAKTTGADDLDDDF